MNYENVGVKLSAEDLQEIRDLHIPLEYTQVINPHELPGFTGDPPETTSLSPGVKAEAFVVHDVAGKALPLYIPKWWGSELTYRNHEYTMKLLHFEANGHTSGHFHVKKHETLLVTSGVLTLKTVFDKRVCYYRLPPGTAWVVPPGYPHMLIAAEGPVDLVEASTFDSPEDSIRLF